jgi:hypothetical protein
MLNIQHKEERVPNVVPITTRREMARKPHEHDPPATLQ